MSATLDIELSLFGIRVNPLSLQELEQIVHKAIEQRESVTLGNHNLHSAYLALTDEHFRQSCRSFDYRLIDGFPILVSASIAARRWLGTSRRLGSMDWIPHVVRAGSVRRLAVVGSTAESNAGAVQALRSIAPSVCIFGWSGIGWNKNLESSVVREVREFHPDLLIVGLGMPLQEKFIASVLGDLPAVVASVGGAIDQLSGYQVPAPRWLGRVGLEWLWRLVRQPRRLSSRYVIEPVLLLRELWRAQHAISLSRHKGVERPWNEGRFRRGDGQI